MPEISKTKTIGIVAHSAEGGALCFLTACRKGQERLGPHFHPEIVLSAIPMGISLPGWRSGDHQTVAAELRRGVEQVARSGADFFICPDNTAHIVLEQIIDSLPIPGIHIADVVCAEMKKNGWATAGVLGTEWTMSGTVYPRALTRHGFQHIIPDSSSREMIDTAIFDELCLGVFDPKTTALFVDAIGDLRSRGADCVILGCTEIPLIISEENSPLPVLDSTRLLANYAVREAIEESTSWKKRGWLYRDGLL